MKRWIKWTASGAMLLGAIVIGSAASGLYLAEQKRNRTIDIKPRPVAYTTDAQTIERGRYLYASRSCSYCHGAQGTGREFVNDGKGTRIVGPNIRPAGVVARYPPEDWNSVIRHGVKPNGRPLLAMPSEDYNRFTNEDLNALVSYVRQFPPKEGEQAVIDLPHPAWVLYGLGAIPDAASRIDHQLAPSRPTAAGVTLANGQYVANMAPAAPVPICRAARFRARRPIGLRPQTSVLAHTARAPPWPAIPTLPVLCPCCAPASDRTARPSRSCPSSRWVS
ncbi:c-type cytochrome [Acidovorax temperans]|uniref:c-type cytochrome n=1 Tax=Acidovorax temperans TaxID=80878 RepID=UPI0030805A99